jgi:hypothetical protein
MRTHSIISAGFAVLAVWAYGANVRGQFEPPPDSLRYEDTGKLEAVQPGALLIRDSKMEQWLLELAADTKVSVQGEAEVDCLRPGLFVQLTGNVDKKGVIKEPIDEIEIFSAQGKGAMGLFSASATDAAVKALRNPGAGEYRIKGKLASFHDREVAIAIGGNRKILGNTADELTVTLNLDDPSIAQVGDEVKVTAWYYERNKPNPVLMRPGRALVQEATITLAKPLAHTGKKIRQAPERPTKSGSKSSKLSR